MSQCLGVVAGIALQAFVSRAGGTRGAEMLGELPVAPFLYLLYSDRVTSSRGENVQEICYGNLVW